jgi:hypothetical protein
MHRDHVRKQRARVPARQSWSLPNILFIFRDPSDIYTNTVAIGPGGVLWCDSRTLEISILKPFGE